MSKLLDLDKEYVEDIFIEFSDAQKKVLIDHHLKKIVTNEETYYAIDSFIVNIPSLGTGVDAKQILHKLLRLAKKRFAFYYRIQEIYVPGGEQKIHTLLHLNKPIRVKSTEEIMRKYNKQRN